jgi:hypothetical protein
MIHHGRFGRDTTKVAQRPNTILRRHMPDRIGRLLSQSTSTNHLDLLNELVPITDDRKRERGQNVGLMVVLCILS